MANLEWINAIVENNNPWVLTSQEEDTIVIVMPLLGMAILGNASAPLGKAPILNMAVEATSMFFGTIAI